MLKWYVSHLKAPAFGANLVSNLDLWSNVRTVDAVVTERESQVNISALHY